MRTTIGALILLPFALTACRNNTTPRTTTNVVQSPADQSTAPPSTVAAAQVIMVGCVKPADKTAGGASGEPDTKYMLANAWPSSGSTDLATGTAGTTMPGRTGNTYRLQSDNGDEAIASVVEHQVEVTAVEELPPSGSPASSVPVLKAKTIKMIAPECPATAAPKATAR